ncbi:unnamed protein product [Phaeothamnion confervicola]
MLILKNVTPVPQLIEYHTPRLIRWTTRWLARSLPAALDATSNAAKSSNPCLFLMSRGDRLSPPIQQEAVRRVYRGPSKICLVDGEHDQHVLEPGDDAQYKQCIEYAYKQGHRST